MIDGIEGGLENRTCIFISPSESYLEVWQQWFKFKFSEFLEWEQLLLNILDTLTYSAVIQVQARNVSLQYVRPQPWHFLIYHLNYKWEASRLQKYLEINRSTLLNILHNILFEIRLSLVKLYHHHHHHHPFVFCGRCNIIWSYETCVSFSVLVGRSKNSKWTHSHWHISWLILKGNQN